MGRIRTIKPEFFLNEDLYDLEVETELPVRLAYSGLWCQCDREGRFKWQPRKLKVTVLPYDDVDFSRVLDALATRGFVEKYADETGEFGHIPGFLEHQVVNNREKASTLPNPADCKALTRAPRVADASSTRAVGKGREGKGREQGGGASRKTPLPDNFVVDDSMREWVSDKYPQLDWNTATDKWRTAMKAQGRKYVDWRSAWQSGMDKADEWRLEKQPANSFAELREAIDGL